MDIDIFVEELMDYYKKFNYYYLNLKKIKNKIIQYQMLKILYFKKLSKYKKLNDFRREDLYLFYQLRNFDMKIRDYPKGHISIEIHSFLNLWLWNHIYQKIKYEKKYSIPKTPFLQRYLFNNLEDDNLNLILREIICYKKVQEYYPKDVKIKFKRSDIDNYSQKVNQYKKLFNKKYNEYIDDKVINLKEKIDDKIENININLENNKDKYDNNYVKYIKKFIKFFKNIIYQFNKFNPFELNNSKYDINQKVNFYIYNFNYQGRYYFDKNNCQEKLLIEKSDNNDIIFFYCNINNINLEFSEDINYTFDVNIIKNFMNYSKCQEMILKHLGNKDFKKIKKEYLEIDK